jgi:short-subunit dehydrogenase
VIALSETLDAEFAGTDVRVTVLCPMFFQTNIAKSGRITDEKVRSVFEGFVDKGKTADVIARSALASVDRGSLYALPMADGRWLWRMKRMAPAFFSIMNGQIGKRAV